MNIKKFREVIKQIEYAEEISHGEWDDEFKRCRNEEIEKLSEDANSTINFLKNECTADEYSWISEVIDDIARETQSRALVECYKSLMAKFPSAPS